jgi:rare lipoprotein A
MKLILAILFSLSISANASTQKGIATWYGKENKISSTGKRLHSNTPAVAHQHVRIGSWIKITSVKSKKSVIAVVEDRGPYKKNRIVDLNYVAAKQLGIIQRGLDRVIVQPL